jgi:hypothetical protein
MSSEPSKQARGRRKKKEETDNAPLEYSFHIKNVHTNCSLQRLFESLDILRLGDVEKVIMHTKYGGPLTSLDDEGSRHSEAFIYYRGSSRLVSKHPFLQRLLGQGSKPVELVHLLDGDNWVCELNTDHHYHFRTDEYEQKRIIIQSIDSSRSSTDINWIFREHGQVEQVDTVWIKTEQCPTPTRCQSYVYFKEWGDEEYTYKLLDELNEVGVFTIKYDYKDYHDLLWIYELSPKSEHTTEYDFEFGTYGQWFPNDDPSYGSRFDEGNKLNWFFTDEGRFAYSKRIVDEEIKKHGGLFIGPEKQFYKIEIERKPLQFSWTTSGDVDENEEMQKMQLLIMEALQKCLNKG